MSRVKKLFKGHKELLVKFNTFLPDDVEYSEVTFQPNKSDDEYDEVSSQPKKSNVNLEYAVKYLRDVKVFVLSFFMMDDGLFSYIIVFNVE
jgi:histone deacetylase complex regulatory component SIN3